MGGDVINSVAGTMGRIQQCVTIILMMDVPGLLKDNVLQKTAGTIKVILLV